MTHYDDTNTLGYTDAQLADLNGRLDAAISAEGGDVDEDRFKQLVFRVLTNYDNEHDDDPLAECGGHPASPFDTMGETVYCDGSCITA